MGAGELVCADVYSSRTSTPAGRRDELVISPAVYRKVIFMLPKSDDADAPTAWFRAIQCVLPPESASNKHPNLKILRVTL